MKPRGLSANKQNGQNPRPVSAAPGTKEREVEQINAVYGRLSSSKPNKAVLLH